MLRDSDNVGTRRAADTSVEQLVELMTGRPAGTVFPTRGGAGLAGEPRLAVRDLSSPPRVLGVSFEARAGEIVGLAGLVGSGRTETFKTIFGAMARGGSVSSTAGRSRSRPLPPRSTPGSASSRRTARSSIFPDHSLLANICVAAASSSRGERLSGALPFILSPRRMSEVAERLRAALRSRRTRSKSDLEPVRWQSAKAILARWVATKPRVVLADEPTRGVSIGSKIELYRLLRKLAARAPRW